MARGLARWKYFGAQWGRARYQVIEEKRVQDAVQKASEGKQCSSKGTHDLLDESQDVVDISEVFVGEEHHQVANREWWERCHWGVHPATAPEREGLGDIEFKVMQFMQRLEEEDLREVV